MVSEILFYHLERQSLEEALPKLLEASLKRGWRAVVQAPDEARVKALDEHLWRWRDDSFLPHGADGDERLQGLAADQPIWVTAKDETPNDAQVLFLVEGAARQALDDFERCVFMFNGRDEEGLAQARKKWSELKQAGHDMTYWQQNNDGVWEKQA